MTVCIAGKCSEERIILCADSRLESDEAGGDVGFKMDVLCDGVVGMVAGGFGHGLEQLKFLHQHLDSKHFTEPIAFLLALREGLYAYRRMRVEHLVQSRLSLDYDELLDIGKEKLPEAFFEKTIEGVAALDTGCEFIVSGFINRQAVIYQIDPECDVVEEDPFACIGSGASAAQTMLFNRRYRATLDYYEALYYIYEAKRISEAAPGVGKKTHIITLWCDATTDTVKSQPLPSVVGIPYLERQFSQFGPQVFKSPPESERFMVRTGPTKEGPQGPGSPTADS